MQLGHGSICLHFPTITSHDIQPIASEPHPGMPHSNTVLTFPYMKVTSLPRRGQGGGKKLQAFLRLFPLPYSTPA